MAGRLLKERIEMEQALLEVTWVTGRNGTRMEEDVNWLAATTKRNREREE